MRKEYQLEKIRALALVAILVAAFAVSMGIYNGLQFTALEDRLEETEKRLESKIELMQPVFIPIPGPQGPSCPGTAEAPFEYDDAITRQHMLMESEHDSS